MEVTYIKLTNEVGALTINCNYISFVITRHND